MANNNLGSPTSGTMFLCKAVISGVTSTGATTITTTPPGASGATMQYAVHGKAYTHDAMSSHATPTTDINTGVAFVAVPANKGCVFLLALGADGTFVAAQGPQVDTDNSYVFKSAPEFPPLSDLYAPFGYIVVSTISTNTGWTFGTSNWNATGVTATPVDIIMVPGRPQVA